MVPRGSSASLQRHVVLHSSEHDELHLALRETLRVEELVLTSQRYRLIAPVPLGEGLSHRARRHRDSTITRCHPPTQNVSNNTTFILFCSTVSPTKCQVLLWTFSRICLGCIDTEKLAQAVLGRRALQTENREGRRPHGWQTNGPGYNTGRPRGGSKWVMVEESSWMDEWGRHVELQDLAHNEPIRCRACDITPYGGYYYT